MGPDVIDVSTLVKSGYFTYDPGFLSTAACESKITFIDGDQGILLYRGYPIDQLAIDSNFVEVCYLLLNGELPDQKRNMTNSAKRLIVTPWFTNKSAIFLMDFEETRIPWQSW